MISNQPSPINEQVTVSLPAPFQSQLQGVCRAAPIQSSVDPMNNKNQLREIMSKITLGALN